MLRARIATRSPGSVSARKPWPNRADSGASSAKVMVRSANATAGRWGQLLAPYSTMSWIGTVNLRHDLAHDAFGPAHGVRVAHSDDEVPGPGIGECGQL